VLYVRENVGLTFYMASGEKQRESLLPRFRRALVTLLSGCHGSGRTVHDGSG